MPRFVLLCPPGRLMTEEEKKILYSAEDDLGIKIVECRGQFCLMEGEKAVVDMLLNRLPEGWTRGILSGSVRR